MSKPAPQSLTIRPTAPDSQGARPSVELIDPPDELQRVRQWSRWLDTAFEVPVLGWRFGFDALIGLVPGAGDLATTFASLYLMALASRCGMPRIMLARMALNVAIDMLLGSLPLVGDVLDVWWKANYRNARLLETRLAETPAEARRHTATDWLFVGAIFAALLTLLVVLGAMTLLMAAALWRAIWGLLAG